MNELKFEKGDRVWSFLEQAWGEVMKPPHGVNEVRVEFADGKVKSRDLRLVFFEEIRISESARVRPKPKHEFKPGDPVCVKGASGIWHCRVFVRIQSSDGRFLCRANEDVSDTGDWRECVPYNRTLLGFDAVEEKNDDCI